MTAPPLTSLDDAVNMTGPIVRPATLSDRALITARSTAGAAASARCSPSPVPR